MATRKAKGKSGSIHEINFSTTSGGRPNQARLDTKSNPLVRAVSSKVKLVAAQRGIERAELAATLGVQERIMDQVWNETALPGPELAYRIEQWFQDPSLTWKFRPRLKKRAEGTALQVRRNEWVRRIIWLPVPLVARLESTCAATGYSDEAFIQIAVARLLEHEPTMTTLRDAVEELEKLLIQRAVNHNPHLWAILEMDESVIPTEMPSKLMDAPVEVSPLGTVRIAETPVFDGPASLISSDEDMLEEV